MPAPINVELRGYLDFFGLKNGGANPQRLGADIAPVCDLQQWYLESRAQNFDCQLGPVTGVGASDPAFWPITATSPPGLSNGVNLIVPQFETWWLLPGSFVSIGYGTVAGQSTHVGVIVSPRMPIFSRGTFIPFDPPVGFAASDATFVRTSHRTLSQPYWLPSGSFITGYTFGANIAGSPINLGLSLRIVRLRS